jgi:sec-independent protein translocase protein TatC
VLLCRVGILSVETLRKGRRYAIVGMFVVAAVLTPPDVISQIGLAVPMLLLYELSILAAVWMARKPKSEAAKKT